jgi:phage shock protein A
MLKRIWGYLKQLFRSTAERAMDPEVEIEQAISEARSRDQELRNQAAKVIAHRTQLEQKIETAARDLGEARETAKQALLRAERAKEAGDAADVTKWTQAAQSLALKLQAAESNLTGLKEQYEIAITQADDAKTAVQQNAMRLQELAARRMQLVGKLQQTKMQEAVNSAVESISASMEVEAPTLGRVEDKINARLAEAKARTELREATPEGAEAELREAISLAQADAKLEELKKELGLTEG